MHQMKMGRKIALTGGPCAGKTTIADVLGRAYSDKLIVVPESASLLFRGGFPRWPGPACVEAFQSSVFHIQTQIENAYEGNFPDSVFILDRGTVDGAAYWPKGPMDFFRRMGTTERQELNRYSRVIFLESASERDYEYHQSKNPVRRENWEEAHRLDTLTREIWSRHPRISFVPNRKSFVDKVLLVLEILEQELGAAAALPKSIAETVK